MTNSVWATLPERLVVSVAAGHTLDRPTPAELATALGAYETRAGIRLPASYQEFLSLFGPGELAGYFRIACPIPLRLRGLVGDVFDIDHQREMLDDPDGYWAASVAPSLTRRLVLFAETIGGDWLFWDIEDVRDVARSEYGVYGFARGARQGGELVAENFADFITEVCLGRGFPVTNYPWEPEWEFTPAWPIRTGRA